MEWLARTYVHAMNCIHYMHDKYFYERWRWRSTIATFSRTMAFGIAGLSVVPTASARSSTERSVSPRCDDRVGRRLSERREQGDAAIRQQRRPRRSNRVGASSPASWEDTQTPDLSQRDAHPKRAHHHFERGVRQGYGNTPDGRRKGEPFGPGANPMHGRDSHGWLASCLSVAKLPYKDAQDGISYTVSIAPQKAHLSEGQLWMRPSRLSTSTSSEAAST
jgi:formate C-acetyltransferase